MISGLLQRFAWLPDRNDKVNEMVDMNTQKTDSESIVDRVKHLNRSLVNTRIEDAGIM